MSRSAVPLVHEVIPWIDALTKCLDDHVDDVDALPAVRAAADKGRVMLHKYYSRTDDSHVYRIAMSKSFLPSLLPYFSLLTSLFI
jgi:MoxR-like ATPase